MPSQDKLIKEGIKYTDKLFKEISRRIAQGILTTDTLEEFLAKTSEYTANNPLITTGYRDTMLELILQETNNHKFSRPSQRELTRITIENRVGDLIADVGENIKNNVRNIMIEEYNQGSNPQKMAKRISDEINVIKNKRAKTIARTEVARASTVSDYIISKEQGATHFTVTCRHNCCPICAKEYAGVTDVNYKMNYDQIQNLKRRLKNNPRGKQATKIRSQLSELEDSQNIITDFNGKQIGGNVEFSIDQVEMLPPLHPNCRCVADFYKK